MDHSIKEEEMARLDRMNVSLCVSEVRSYQRVYLFHRQEHLPPPARLGAVVKHDV